MKIDLNSKSNLGTFKQGAEYDINVSSFHPFLFAETVLKRYKNGVHALFALFG